VTDSASAAEQRGDSATAPGAEIRFSVTQELGAVACHDGSEWQGTDASRAARAAATFRDSNFQRRADAGSFGVALMTCYPVRR